MLEQIHEISCSRKEKRGWFLRNKRRRQQKTALLIQVMDWVTGVMHPMSKKWLTKREEELKSKNGWHIRHRLIQRDKETTSNSSQKVCGCSFLLNSLIPYIMNMIIPDPFCEKEPTWKHSLRFSSKWVLQFSEHGINETFEERKRRIDQRRIKKKKRKTNEEFVSKLRDLFVKNALNGSKRHTSTTLE
jgi:hypothetical protein